MRAAEIVVAVAGLALVSWAFYNLFQLADMMVEAAKVLAP